MSEIKRIYEVWDGFGAHRLSTEDRNEAARLVDALRNEEVWSKIHTTSLWDCPRCGTQVICRGRSTVECEHCNAAYTCSGQRLRDNWRSNPSNYDSEISDMDGYEMQMAGDQ